jgi:hypothetical protein
MARQSATVVQNNFIKGLITENTALNFPEDACTDTLNCVFDETGRITRRGGLDLEADYVSLDNSSITLGVAFSEYIWDQVAGTGTVTFLVQQEGSIIKFFDISSSTTVTNSGLIGSIDLSTYLAESSPYNSSNYTCTYAKGNGELIIVNPSIDPIYVTYDPTLNSFSVSRINIKYRDFIGVAYTDSTYTDAYRPSFADINTMKTDSSSGNNGARHFYNLLNQGWWQGNVSGGNPDSSSALGQWDTARTDMPSNSDRVESYRSSFTDAFDNARVGSYDQGNTPASKGHFILDLGGADRQEALTDEGYTLSYSAEVQTLISGGSGTTLAGGSATGYDSSYYISSIDTKANAFDTSTATSVIYIGYDSSPSSGTKTLTYFIGKNYGTSPTTVGKVTLRPRISGSSSIFGYAADSDSNVKSCTLTYELRGHSSSPSSGSEGTLLGTATKSITSSNYGSQSDFTISSSNVSTSYQYVWVRIINSSTDTSSPFLEFGYIQLSTVEFYDSVEISGDANLPAADTTYERPSCVEWFAARAWYAGVSYSGLSNNLYFSQVIEKPEQYGRCYQLNDPTAESLRDILPTDGGVIKIPDVGKIIRLWAYQTALIVFATNGVWIIRGENGFFTPTNFSVRKISSLGTQSPLSFCDVRGVPTWWGEDGILQIEYNPQFDSFSVVNMTDETIRTLFLGILPSDRKYVKAAYDSRESIVYWLYNDVEEAPLYTYNKALCLNTLSGAFYPFEFFDAQNIYINGIVFASDSVGTSDPKIKVVTSYVIDTGITRLHYCDFKTDVYADYVNYSSLVTLDADDTGNYQSYFITGYKTDGELLRFVQPNYVMVFLEQETNASCYMRGIFDFTNSGNSGKWSSSQQIYNNTATNKDVNYKRLKVRGKGRSIQLKFFSDTDKPFTIIGWSAFETANSEV